MNTQPLSIDHSRKLLTDAFYRAHEIQHTLNSQLSCEYPRMGWSFLRAAWLEAAEALETLNWKWWKGGRFGQEPTPEQKKVLWMELVDVFHFLLAHFLTLAYENAFRTRAPRDTISGTSLQSSASALAQAFSTRYTRATPEPGDLEPFNWVEPLATAIEQFINAAIGSASHEGLSGRFATMCAYADLSAEQLLSYYSAKQVLNEFRWEHGYREGTYMKAWRGEDGKDRDDTDVLLAILDTDTLLSSPAGKAGLATGGSDQLIRLRTLLSAEYAAAEARYRTSQEAPATT